MLGGLMKRWLVLALLLPKLAFADVFVVSDIRIQGLQRVSAGTVFNLLPVNVGDTVDEVSIRQLIRLLFQSGYFRDIRMSAKVTRSSCASLNVRPSIRSRSRATNRSRRMHCSRVSANKV